MNLRGLEMRFDPMADQQQEPQPQQQVKTEEVESPIKQGKIETLEERQERLNMKGGQKKKLTPEELVALRAKYPEMQWGANALDEIDIDSFKDSVDVTSPALRPGL
jgi:hypothetical protein